MPKAYAIKFSPGAPPIKIPLRLLHAQKDGGAVILTFDTPESEGVPFDAEEVLEIEVEFFADEAKPSLPPPPIGSYAMPLRWWETLRVMWWDASNDIRARIFFNAVDEGRTARAAFNLALKN